MTFKCLLVALALFVPSLAIAKEAPPTLEQRCTSDEASAYRGDGRNTRYIFDVANTCAKTLRCELHISILNAYGLTRGDKVFVIAPKSHKSLVLRLKGSGGMNTHRHDCKEV